MKKKTTTTEPVQEKIIRTEYSDIMQKSYIDYAMSVIISRALPDVRDGLKPVQRRTLYDMHELGIYWNRPYRKSARIVGDTMGKYHPHGDSSIYGALVVLAQDFKMGVPLVDGHGNFGSIEGDGAAAMRYTEARLQKITQEVFLSDMDKDVVRFVPNFDETEKEPEVLPARIPNLLVNGSEGIAVGMVTSIPPHNLGEVIDAVIALIKDSTLSDDDLMQYIKGPDFPTGGIVTNQDELAQIYRTGTGKIRVRGRVETEPVKGGREALVITEIPYTMLGANIGKFLNDVAALVENKTTTDIADISNQSSKEGIRIVIELRKGADAQQVKNLLLRKTRLEDTFAVNMLAVSEGRPETLSLRAILDSHIDFQFEVATRKYQTLLSKEQERREIQEGLIRACDCIDLIIEILRGSQNMKQAKACLVTGETEGIRFKSQKSRKEAATLHFTEAQADAILQMRLYRLIGLEIDALRKEYDKTVKNIDKYTDILNNYASMARVIVGELQQIRDEYAVPRRTAIENAEEIVLEQKKPEAVPAVFLMDRFGYARCIDPQVYEKNKEAADAQNSYVIPCRTDSRLCVITDKGRSHILKASVVPFGKFRDKGTPIDNLCHYDSSQEHFVAVFLPGEGHAEDLLLFVTRHGWVRRVPAGEFDLSRLTSQAGKMDEDDELVAVMPVGESDDLILQTRKGYVLRQKTAQIPTQKRSARGVRGIRLGDGDEVDDAALYTHNAGESTVEISGRTIPVARLRTAARDTRGSRIKL